jgi:hypothetical protein
MADFSGYQKYYGPQTKMVKEGSRNIHYNLPDMAPHPVRKLLGRARYMPKGFRWPVLVFAALVLGGGALFSATMDLR